MEIKTDKITLTCPYCGAEVDIQQQGKVMAQDLYAEMCEDCSYSGSYTLASGWFVFSLYYGGVPTYYKISEVGK